MGLKEEEEHGSKYTKTARSGQPGDYSVPKGLLDVGEGKSGQL